MHAIWALARKDLKLLLRDGAGFFFTFIFPILFALFFGWILRGAGGGGGGSEAAGIAVVLIDEDRTDASRAFIKTLSEATELRAHTVDDVKLAEAEVQNAKSVAMIRLMPGFGKGQENIFWRGGDQSTIEVAADPSKSAEVGMLQGVLQKYAYSGMSKAFTDPTVSRRQIDSARRQLDASQVAPADRQMFDSFFGSLDRFMTGLDERDKREVAAGAASDGGFSFEPVKIVSRDLFRPRGDRPQNRFTYTFPQGIVWGLMGAALGFAASLHSERAAGTFGRLAASPLPTWGVLAGKGLACFITMMGVTALMITVAVVVCGVTIKHPLLLAAGLVSVSIGFVGIMTLVATLTRSERAAQGLGWMVMIVFAFVGGAAIPSFIFPATLLKFSQVSPMYWAIRAFESGLWRDLSPAQAALPLAIMIAVGIVGFGVGVASMRRG